MSGDRIALVDGERRMTYAELDISTNQLARALRSLGVRQGDRVAGLLLNSTAFIETMLATAKLGAVFVPMNVRLAPAEVSYLLADSGSDTFVYSAPLASVARSALAGDGVRVRSRLIVGGEPVEGEVRYEQVLAGGGPRSVDTDVDRRDLSCLMYTSGTTGRPKGAILTHDNHMWNVVNSLSFGRGLRESDVTVTVAPMFHIGGLGIHTLPLLYVGGTNVVLPRSIRCGPWTPCPRSEPPCSSWSRPCGRLSCRSPDSTMSTCRRWTSPCRVEHPVRSR